MVQATETPNSMFNAFQRWFGVIPKFEDVPPSVLEAEEFADAGFNMPLKFERN